jgi:hypothetical protein
MRIVQTLVVRDEVDVVGDQIAFHLNAGVDFVLATDHESRDGTSEVLEAYAREGVLRRIAVEGEMRESVWRTRMARLAATEHGADWVVHTDADEFWLPREGTLRGALAAVPERYDIVWALSRHFVPRPEDGRDFGERMTVRLSASAPINDPTSPYRPHQKIAHRADSRIRIRFGAHLAYAPWLSALHHWHVADVLHFPFRTFGQYERKCLRRAEGDTRLGQYVSALRAAEAGRIERVYRALVVDDAAVERGRAAGFLVGDTRVRDGLRALRAGAGAGEPRAAAGEPYDHAQARAEAAALRDADVVRMAREIETVRARVAVVERGSRAQLARRVHRLSRRRHRLLGATTGS